MNEKRIVSVERIFPFGSGGFVVVGPDGTPWYLVSAREATRDDYAKMMSLEPKQRKPVRINDKNIEQFRRLGS